MLRLKKLFNILMGFNVIYIILGFTSFIITPLGMIISFIISSIYLYFEYFQKNQKEIKMAQLKGFKTQNFSLIIEEDKDRHGITDTTYIVNGVVTDKDEIEEIFHGILDQFPYILNCS